MQCMPQSLSRVLVNLVFSTKGRERFIKRDSWDEVHRYLAGVLRNEKCPPIVVGGVEDHIHLLFGMARTLTISQTVEAVKTSAFKYVKVKFGETGIAWH